MNRAQADALVAVLIGAYPGARITAATPQVFATALRDLDFATADAAVKRLLVSAKFMPTIAEIREAAVELVNGDQRAGAEAWGDVVRAVGRFGINRAPIAPADVVDGEVPPDRFVFDDPLVAAGVDAVGWRAICNSEETDPAPRAKFADAYNAAARRARTVAAGTRGAANPQLTQRSNRELPVADLMKQIVESAGEESDNADDS